MIKYIKENNEDVIEMPLECIEGATLLSKEEYIKYRNNISLIDNWWWLRSAGHSNNAACGVGHDGIIVNYCSVDLDYGAIRPVLALAIQSLNLDIGDIFQFGGYTFTIISNDLAICDDFIKKSCFREDLQAEDANVYIKSDAKKNIDNWFIKSYSNEDSMLKVTKSDSSFFKEDDWGF